MPFFPLTTLQEMVLAFFLGLGILCLLYIAWSSYPKRPAALTGKDNQEPEGFEPGEEQKKTHNPMPPFLAWVYVIVIVWALSYLVFIGLRVKAIG